MGLVDRVNVGAFGVRVCHLPHPRVVGYPEQELCESATSIIFSISVSEYGWPSVSRRSGQLRCKKAY